MIPGKVTALLLAALAATAWMLYTQTTRNGELRARLEQRQQEIDAAGQVIKALQIEIDARDAAVKQLQVQVDDYRNRAEQVRTVVRKVYVRPDVAPWAETQPPEAAAAAILGGIDCLWQQPTRADNADCGDRAASGDAG